MVAALEARGSPSQAEFHAAIVRRSDGWYAACLRITRNPGLAEEAVQEALLCAWDKRDQFRRSSTLETWIHRIAVNAALQLIRKERPNRFQPLATEMVDEITSPEQEARDRDAGLVLAAAFKYLSDIERVCFVLKHMEQWRLREIADELDTDVGSVKQAIFRAVKKLRARMPELQACEP